jgi:acetylornithine deacetylase/succinyl-diaminopimelate desuccinylase-like protein
MMLRPLVRSSARAALATAIALALAAPALAAPPVRIDPAEGRQTVQLLQELIRIDTSNPPGDTRRAAEHLKRIFDAAGVETEIVVAPNGKAAHFFARLKGDGSKPPVLLAAHTDVVPAAPADWSVDPFAGVEKDGYVWGRGALDNKGAVAAFARAVLRLARDKTPLARDVIFLAEADEEQGQFNTGWLADTQWAKIDAAFVLNEGGGVQQSADGKVTHVDVSYADKMTLTLRLRTRGPAGHSSRPMPPEVTANGQLIEALHRLSGYRPPIQLVDSTRTKLLALRKVYPDTLGPPIAALLAASDDAGRAAAADALIRADGGGGGFGIEGLLRNTVVITMIDAGLKPNIIPGKAEAIVNCRLLPGTKVADMVAEVARVIGNPNVEIEVTNRPKAELAEFLRRREAIAPSRLDTDLYRAIERSAAAVWPGAPTVPTLLTATTDATPWRERGVPVYGIGPFPVDAALSRTIHGDDERVSVRSVHEGSEFVYRIVRDIAARR